MSLSSLVRALVASRTDRTGAHGAAVFSQVDPVIRVATRTEDLSEVGALKGIATACVYTMGDSLQVLGVDAIADPTKVVKFKVVRDFADQQGVNNAMSAAAFALPTDVRIIPFIDESRPDPATRDWANEDLQPDAIWESRVAPRTIEHIDSSQSVTPRGVSAPAGLLPVIIRLMGSAL